MSPRYCLLATAILLCATLNAQQETPIPSGSQFIEHELMIPVPESGPSGLDVLEVYITTPGKHPLALLTHGTSAVPEEREQLTPWAQLAQALWFARRGYVAFVIIRRGYGRSGGAEDGAHSPCRSGSSFHEVGENSADDLRNVAAYAGKHLPEVDVSTIISAGVSTGGFAQVALVADPPPGLKAAISFAGGRGGDGKGHLCDENGLIDGFKQFGKHSHLPMLWVYSENDKWFPPTYAREFEAAYQKGGGMDEFVLAPPDGEDGHHLYAHVAAWAPIVEPFLREHQLLPVPIPYVAPDPPNVTPPAGLSQGGLEGFRNFLILGPHKAFATNGVGEWGSAVGQFTQELADQHALANCEKRRHEGPKCTIVLRDTAK
jgi:dienelactone hydrolase